jgi:hypothetical protein
MLEDTGNFVLRATAIVGLTANGRVDASWMVYTGNEWMPGADAIFDLGRSNFRPRDLWLSRLIDYTALTAAPPTPAAGHVITYAKTDKRIYAQDDAGVETALGGSSGMTNPMTMSGDLIVGGSAGAPGRFAAVATGAVLASAGLNTAPVWSASPALTDVKLGGGALGTSGVGVLALGPSTAPTTSPVDTVQFYTLDLEAEAGSRGVGLRDERGQIIEFGSTSLYTGIGTSVAANRDIRIWAGNPRKRYVFGTTGDVTIPNALIINSPATTAIVRMDASGIGGHQYDLFSGGTGTTYGSPGYWGLRDMTLAMTLMEFHTDGRFYLRTGDMAPRLVWTGAIDSGGAGYRQLIIAN